MVGNATVMLRGHERERLGVGIAMGKRVVWERSGRRVRCGRQIGGGRGTCCGVGGS
jgi:hypothetical protein